jgi:hypothetical protein
MTWGVDGLTGLVWLRMGMESCCEFGNEPSGSMKCWEVLEWLHNWWAQSHRVSSLVC